MDTGSAENLYNFNLDTPDGVWSDVAPAREVTGPQTEPPPIPATALKPPPIPRLPGITLLLGAADDEDPIEEEPEPTLKRLETTAALAFRVEPTVEPLGTVSPPPLRSVPPRRLVSTERPKELRNPWERNTTPPTQPAKERGPDMRSGAVGFVLGLAVATAVAFSIWPQAELTPVAEIHEPTIHAPEATAGAPAAAQPAEAHPAEIGENDAVSTLEQSPEPAEEPEPVAEEPVAHVNNVIATASTSEADAATRARWAERRRARRAERAAAPELVPPSQDEPELPSGEEPVIGAEPTPAPTPETPIDVASVEPDLPDHPTRQDVAAAIHAIQAQLHECAPSHRGHVANIRFTFTSAGRATAALVPHDFAGPAERSCVARAARTAQVPAFSEPRLVVTYPVQF